MAMNRRLMLGGLSAFVFVAVVMNLLWRQPIAASDDTEPQHETSMSDLMHQKMSSSQLILVGLVNRDMNVVHEGGSELISLAKSAAWMETTNDPVYLHFNAEFQRLSERVVRMALDNNPDGAAYAYQGLTTTCITCHEHVRDVTRISTEAHE